VAVAPDHTAPPAPRKITFLDTIAGYVPTSIVQPFAENSIITVILLAVLAGVALRRVRNEQEARGEEGYRVVADLVATAFRTVEVILAMVLTLVPLAVFGVVAQTVGRYGLSEPVVGLGTYVGVAILGLILQVGIVYQAWLVFAA